MKQKKIPLRRCNGCNEMKPKKELVRVVRSPEGEISLGILKIIPCSISSEKNVNNYQPTPMAADSEEYIRVLSKLDGSFEGPNLKIRKIGK